MNNYLTKINPELSEEKNLLLQEPEYDFKKLPKSVREFSCFLDLIIEDTLENLPDNFTPTYIRCNKRGCHGIISTKIDFDGDTIQWQCSTCPTSGTITNIHWPRSF